MKFAKINIKFGFAKVVGLNKKVEFGYGKDYYIPLELMKDFNAFAVNNMISVDEKIYSENELNPKLKVFTGLKTVPVKQFLNKEPVSTKSTEAKVKKDEDEKKIEDLTKKEMIKLILEADDLNYKEKDLKKLNKGELTSILINLSEGNII